MASMLVALMDSIRAATKAASMVEWTDFLMVAKLVATMVV